MTVHRLFITNPQKLIINTNVKEQMNYEKNKFINELSNFEKLSLDNNIDKNCFHKPKSLNIY